MVEICAAFIGLFEISTWVFLWKKTKTKLKKESSGWDLKGGRKSVLSWTAFLAKQQILLFSLGNSRSPLNAMPIGLTIA